MRANELLCLRLGGCLLALVTGIGLVGYLRGDFWHTLAVASSVILILSGGLGLIISFIAWVETR